MPDRDKKFSITLDKFHVGAAPFAHLDSLTEQGNGGHYSVAQNVDIISKPGVLTQGPGLANLTNGTQAGAVTDLINFIQDIPAASDQTYAVSDTKLHRVSSTAVVNTGSFPHTITNATQGKSVIYFQGAEYYFFNTASAGNIGKYDLASTFDDDWGSTVPTGAAALQKAEHPVAVKQDLMVFGNGRYVGTYTASTNTLAPTKLDFGTNAEVADVAFDSNQWWLAVNYGVPTGTNRAMAEIYLWDAAALTSILTDETAVGLQRIGFILSLNGFIYVAYQDLSSTGGFAIGYISGRSLIPLRHFTGTLPTYAQKTVYKGMIGFVAGGLFYTVGAVAKELPVQISQHADAGYATAGGIAAPFGTLMIASTESSSFRLAQFSGFDTACSWKSVIIPTIAGTMVGYIDKIIVLTRTLGASASCALTVEYDQAASSGSSKTITGTGKRRHVLKDFGVKAAEDIRIALSWSGGSASNDCAIRRIIVEGHYVEKS